MKKTITSLAFVLVLLFLNFPALIQAQETHYKILIVNSYHPGFPWSDGILTGIKDTLYKGLQYPEISVEFLDTKRHFEGIESELMLKYRDILKMKYKQDYFDLIFVTDDNAYQFSLRYGTELFGTTPVVFCGVNNFDAEQLNNNPNYTGVVEKADDATTISLMLKLHPSVNTIAFITDQTTSGKGNRRRLTTIAENMSDKARFYFIVPGEGLTSKELKQQVSKLGKNTAIFYRDFFRDKNDVYLPPQKFIPELTAISPVPIYSIGSFYLGLGIVGGKMDRAWEHGEIAAHKGVDILNGKDITQIPIHNKIITKYMFDNKVVDRFDIDRKKLPPESIIINRPFSFYYEYTEVFWSYVTAFSALLLLTLFLIVVTRKRRVANQKLEESNSKLTATLNSIGDAVITTDTEGNITSVNPVAEALLHYSQNEMIGNPIHSFFHLTSHTHQNHSLSIPTIEKEASLKPAEGDPIPISSSTSAIYDHNNGVIGSIIVFRDRTEEHHFQQSIQSALQEKTILLQEIHHRVKNNLNIVVSLLNLQSDQIKNVTDPQAVLINCRNRIYSMALVHEHLYKHESLASIHLDTYIRTITRHLFDLYAHNKQIDYIINTEEVSLHIDKAVPIGLIVNEVLTNALVHAFPDDRKGTIHISLQYINHEDCEIKIEDNGIGFTLPASEYESFSLGLNLVDILSKQISGKLNILHANGTTYTLRIPSINKPK